MKYIKAWKVMPLVALVVFITSCFNPVLDGAGKTAVKDAQNSDKLVTLKLDFGGPQTSGRSIRPVLLSQDIMNVAISMSKVGDIYDTRYESGLPGMNFSFYGIEAGSSWNVSVTCFDFSAVQYGPYTQTITFDAGENLVPISISPSRTVGGNGSFVLRVYNLPFEPNFDTPNYSVSLTNSSNDTLFQGLSYSINTDALGYPYLFAVSEVIPSGDYRLVATYDDVKPMTLVYDTIVKIYDNKLTKGIFGLYGGSGSVVFQPENSYFEFSGKRVFIKVLSQEGFNNWILQSNGNNSYAEPIPEAAAIMTIIGGETNSTGLTVLGTETPFATEKNTPYYVSVLVDMDDSLSAISNVADITDFSIIQANFGDYRSFGGMTDYFRIISSTDTGVLNLDDVNIYQELIVNYFVAQAAAGNGSGADAQNPCTLETALSMAETQSMSGGNITIYLTEDVIETRTYTINVSTTIKSLESDPPKQPYLITYTGEAPFLSVEKIAQQNYGPFVNIYNVVIDGNNMSRLGSLVSVHADSNMNIGEGAIIRNTNSTEVDGGAIWVEGTLYISEGSIYGSSAPNGGAVYVAPGGYLGLAMYDTAKIQNNTATSGAGGGIYLAEGANLSGYSDSIPFVTGNFAEITGTENFALYGNWLSPGMVYVSQNGTGDGSSLEFPTSLATALSSTNSNAFTLLEDISLSVGITLNRNIAIESENLSQKRAIYPSGPLSTPLITVTAGSLYLENVFIGAATQTSSIESLIKVENGSILFVGTGAVIRNHTRTSGNGGGIYANGSQIIFDEGEIYGCSAPQGNGGAVYLAYDSAPQSGSSLSITNSTIGSTDIAKKNSAQNGGGIFVENLCAINFMGSALVQNNTASLNGGGIYIGAGGYLNMQETTNSITGNTATQIGGGAYMEAEGALYPNLEFFSTYCTGNTAPTSPEFYVYVNNPYW